MNSYHYIECGLNNVYIQGLEIVTDDEGDEVITIPNVYALHRAIALGIVSHESSMSGDELRFLRTEMGYTQAELATLVHHDKQTIGRWERSEFEIVGSAEAIIRRLSIEKLKLDAQEGIDELSKRSIPSAINQPITIQKLDDNSANDNSNYELLVA